MISSNWQSTEDLPDLRGVLDLGILSDRAYNHIKRLIMTGKLQGGKKTPEQAIAEQFGAGCTPSREAFRLLEDHGLVVIEPRHSTRVTTITLDDKMVIG